ncbi:MAG: LysR family transcriptional regulator [Myxococcales bacterium]|nr:LysR family transcriptional regulator [Myxococcales bacterium]
MRDATKTGLKVERLEVLLAVIDHGSFTAAARALGTSQSTVSEAVLALERELGESLLVRDGRRAHATPAGEVLARHARRALDELRRAREELAALRAVATGTLRLGVSDTLATYLLPPTFAAFRAAHAGVALKLENRTSPALASLVASRALDLAVVTLPFPTSFRIDGRPAEEKLHLQRLADLREVVVLPADHALASGKGSFPIRRAATVPWVLLGPETSSRAHLDARFEAANVKPEVAMEAASVELLKTLVALGFGLSVLPELAVRREVAAGTLRTRSLTRAPERHVAIVTPTVGPLSPAARAFVETARRHARG